MNIKPSAAIRQNYNEIAELCRSSREPVYLTKNGEGDLVVMDIESFTRREKMLALQEKLLEIERDRINGAKYYTLDELEQELDMLTNAESIKSALGGMAWQIRENDQSVVSVLKHARGALGGIEQSFPEAVEYGKRLDSVIIELNDMADEASRKAEGVEFNEGRIEAIHSRLNVIYDLLYKYKAESVAELIERRKRLEEQLKHIEGGSEAMEELEKRRPEEDKRTAALCFSAAALLVILLI